MMVLKDDDASGKTIAYLDFGGEDVRVINLVLIKTLYFCPMIHDAFTAKKIAELLIQINAIKLELKNPFTWASGWTSPIYCDNRIALSYPTVRTYLREEFAKQIEKHHGKPDAIARHRTLKLQDEIILVGGHLDSWDVGDGAHDDGACKHQSQTFNMRKVSRS